MPKCVKTICVAAMCSTLPFYFLCRCSADLRVSRWKPWSSAGTILGLKTWLLMKLMLRECDPAQSHAASPTCCLPVCLMLNPSYFPVWDANCFIICLPVFVQQQQKKTTKPYRNSRHESENGWLGVGWCSHLILVEGKLYCTLESLITVR